MDATTRSGLSRGGDGPTDTLCFIVGSRRVSLFGEGRISTNEDCAVAAFLDGDAACCFVGTSLGGEGPTAMSWRMRACTVRSLLRSLVGVANLLGDLSAVLSSRGGDGPQPVELRSFETFATFVTLSSEISKNTS